MITYRKAALQDIPEILGCLRGVYGDHSYYSSYYDPAYLREIIDNIFTADADGEVVGTLVLSPWGCDGNDRELGAFLVRSDVRKSNIGTGLLAYTLDAISGLPSVKGVPITYNTGSQSIVGELGFIPSGMLFGTIDMNLLTAGKAESAEKKPLILVVRNFNVTDIGEIYVPPPLREPARRLYEKLGVSCSAAALSDVSDAAFIPHIPEASTIRHKHNEQFHFEEFYVIEYGRDCLDRILEIEARHAHPLQTGNVFVNMKDPGAPAAYEALLKASSVYAGFMPLSAGFEYVILHRPGSLPYATEDLRFSEYMGHMLRESLNIRV